MKTLRTIRILKQVSYLLLLTVGILLTSATAKADDFTRTFKEKYTVQKGAVLHIENKFGDVHCQNWDESSVSITVTITVDASSQEKADRVFDKISVELSGSPTRVEGITDVGGISNSEFSIDYDIMMPKWINVDIDNQFGEIYLGVIDGTTNLNVEYGALEADALNGNASDLTIKFSNADVDYFKDGKVLVEYGKFNSEEAGVIKLTSRFSGVDIEKSEKLNLDSQYDEVRIGSVGQVIAVSRFSGLEIDKVSGSFDFDVEYGDIDVSYVSPGFTTGNVRSRFGNASLHFDSRAAFTVDAECEFGELNYPSKNASIKEQTPDFVTNIYKGTIGSAGSPASKLTIDAKNANVDISLSE